MGEGTFTDDRLAAATFRPSEFAKPLVTSVPAPRALDAYLFHGHPWELSDANWSPDFPSSVADLAHLYTLATRHAVNGVIDVDPITLGDVLALLGPVHVPPYPQVVSAQNTLRELNYIVNKARPGDPGKEFLAPFGRVMLDELLGTAPSRLPAVADALARNVAGKHIVLHFDDPALQRLVDEGGGGGRLSAPLSDALLVDDANISGTKGDLFVTRHYDLTATVGSDGEVRDHLVLSYGNPAPATPADAKLVDAVGGEYRDYLRVYVPETGHLDGLTVSVNGHTTTVAPESIVAAPRWCKRQHGR